VLNRATAAELTLTKDVLSKPGIRAYLEYQIEKVFHRCSEGGNCPEEVILTADAIVSLLRSRGLSPNRIAVDGVPGSGKSTLAAALAPQAGYGRRVPGP
jgi:MoxR-like ATPase